MKVAVVFLTQAVLSVAAFTAPQASPRSILGTHGRIRNGQPSTVEAFSLTRLFAANGETNGASPKKVLVLGGDGFCGWPTSLFLSDKGHDVVVVDNLSRRNIDIELGCDSLTPIQPMEVSLDLTGVCTDLRVQLLVRYCCLGSIIVAVSFCGRQSCLA